MAQVRQFRAVLEVLPVELTTGHIGDAPKLLDLPDQILARPSVGSEIANGATTPETAKMQWKHAALIRSYRRARVLNIGNTPSHEQSSEMSQPMACDTPATQSGDDDPDTTD